jgi:hypothetical protein
MLSLIQDGDILKLQQQHPNTYIDKEDLECDMVYNSPQDEIKLPSVFIEHIFPILYGVKLTDVSFKDGNKNNWKYDNIVFPR